MNIIVKSYFFVIMRKIMKVSSKKKIVKSVVQMQNVTRNMSSIHLERIQNFSGANAKCDEKHVIYST